MTWKFDNISHEELSELKEEIETLYKMLRELTDDKVTSAPDEKTPPEPAEPACQTEDEANDSEKGASYSHLPHRKLAIYIAQDLYNNLRLETVKRGKKNVSAFVEEILRMYFNMD